MNSLKSARTALNLPNKICNYYISHLTISCLPKLPFQNIYFFPMQCLICMSQWRQLNTNPGSFFSLSICYFNWMKRYSLSSRSLIYMHVLLFARNTGLETQLAHDVVATLGFGCILVATLDNVVTTLSQHCVSDVITTTKN